jgi:tetratricopeptide (TPR) repeat protein
VALGTESCLAHYYCATLRLDHGTGRAELETAVQSLERAKELNPDFASALAQLAFAYGLQNRNLEEALRLTQRAIELEPTNSFLYLNAGQFSLSLNRIDDARSYAERGLTVPGETKAKGLLQSFLNRLHQTGNPRLDRKSSATDIPLTTTWDGGWFEAEARREEVLTHLLNPDFSG